MLRRLLGGLRDPAWSRFLVRLLIAAGAARPPSPRAAAGVLRAGLGERPGPGSWRRCVPLRGRRAVDVVVFLLLARLLRLDEVTDVVDTVTRRLPLRHAGA